MLYDALTYAEQIETLAIYNRENNQLDNESFLSGLTKEDSRDDE